MKFHELIGLEGETWYRIEPDNGKFDVRVHRGLTSFCSSGITMRSGREIWCGNSKR